LPHRLTLTKTFRFEASHVLPKHPGKCSRLHGHSWVLDVTVDGPLNEQTGFVVDYGELKAVVEDYIISKVDHYHLGYGWVRLVDSDHQRTNTTCLILGDKFYPSSENLVIAFAEILRGPIQALRMGVDLLKLTLHETCTCECTWIREEPNGTDS
jgi:6-pyruvoyltetrahydropterin/6-carboxytetrahydropterin synthase